MAQPDFPYCDLRFFPRRSLWSEGHCGLGRGGGGFGGAPPPLVFEYSKDTLALPTDHMLQLRQSAFSRVFMGKRLRLCARCKSSKQILLKAIPRYVLLCKFVMLNRELKASNDTSGHICHWQLYWWDASCTNRTAYAPGRSSPCCCIQGELSGKEPGKWTQLLKENAKSTLPTRWSLQGV